VLGRIDHRKFEACFLPRTRGYFKESAGSGIAIDGKTVWGSESGEWKAILIVSARADEVGLVLGQVQTEAVFARSMRGHREIENKPHRVLDVVFREDYARKGKDRSAANPAILRKITVSLIRPEATGKYHTRKLSLNRKRLHSALDYLIPAEAVCKKVA
jgi:hypothetical protein